MGKKSKNRPSDPLAPFIKSTELTNLALRSDTNASKAKDLIDGFQSTQDGPINSDQQGGLNKNDQSGGAGSVQALSQASGIAVQSISQSVAIAVADASDFMRDIATIEGTAIGVATKKMIEEKNPLYIPIIVACQETMDWSAKYWSTIGADGATLLGKYSDLVRGKESGE